MTMSRCEGNRVPGPINGSVVAPELRFPDNQVPAGKFSNVESEVLQVLVYGYPQGARVCDLSNLGPNSVS